MLFFYSFVKGLGKLAEKFPNIAGTSISYLRDFLVDPSPILAKLYGQAQQKKDKEPFKIVGELRLSTTYTYLNRIQCFQLTEPFVEQCKVTIIELLMSH